MHRGERSQSPVEIDFCEHVSLSSSYQYRPSNGCTHTQTHDHFERDPGHSAKQGPPTCPQSFPPVPFHAEFVKNHCDKCSNESSDDRPENIQHDSQERPEDQRTQKPTNQGKPSRRRRGPKAPAASSHQPVVGCLTQ